MSDESIKPPAASGNSLTPLLIYGGAKAKVLFDGVCLKQKKVNGKMVNIYIVYEIIRIANINDDKNCKYKLYLEKWTW